MGSEAHHSSSSIPQVIEMRNKDNPRVFMDISFDGNFIGKLVFELYQDLFPKAAENFRALCTGEKALETKCGKPLHYKDSVFYEVQPGVLVEGGDIQNNKGSGGKESIYGGTFEVDWRVVDAGRGMLYMTNGHKRLGSLFLIILASKIIPHFQSHNVAVGRVIEGFDTLDKIDQLGRLHSTHSKLPTITDCGLYTEGEKKITGKRAIVSSDEFFDGQVKKQRESTPNSD